MNRQDFKKLNFPDAPGVYFFLDGAEDNHILYVGRATSLADRVLSYFSNDLIVTRGPLIVDMVTKASTVTFIQTDSVLEAIILESNEIKKHQPYFNTKEKDNKSYNYVVIADEEFPRVIMVRGRTLEALGSDQLKYKIKYKFGPYPQGTLLRDALKIIRKIFPFRDERAGQKHQESFYQSLGLSPETVSAESKKEYQRTIRNLVLFFEGKKFQLMKTLEREMNEYADAQEFEKAQKIRNTLYALSHIQDVSLIKSEKNTKPTNATVYKTSGSLQASGFRIEAYDIAHMSGKSTVGVMTVVTDGEIQKNEYKKFRLSKDANNDVAGLREILTRRLNHPEWGIPNLIVIDGGLGQLNATNELLKGLGMNIPTISVVKDDSHKADHLLGDEKIGQVHMKDILLANTEAHRFAIAYHKLLRRNTFLKK